MEKKDKGFVDFVVDARSNKKLREEFLTLATPQELQKFMAGKGYGRMGLDECEKLIKARKEFTANEADWVKSY